MSDLTTIEVRCPKCKRLLCEAQGVGTVVTIKCPRCETLVQWPSLTPEVARPAWPPKVETKGKPDSD